MTDRIDEFVEHTGLDPSEWLREWHADPDWDTAESMRIAIAALAIESERQDASTGVSHSPVVQPLPAYALAAFTTLNGK